MSLDKYWFEFFRLPVLAGAAGALGTQYCSPYVTADGAYHPLPSGQISSLGAAPMSVEFFADCYDILISLFLFLLACTCYFCSLAFSRVVLLIFISNLFSVYNTTLAFITNFCIKFHMRIQGVGTRWPNQSIYFWVQACSCAPKRNWIICDCNSKYWTGLSSVLVPFENRSGSFMLRVCYLKKSSCAMLSWW